MIAAASPSVLCAASGGSVNLTGLFPKISGVDPVVMLDNTTLTVTASQCSDFIAGVDNVQICTSLVVTVPIMSISGSYYTPSISVMTESGCSDMFQPLFLSGPLTFAPATFPVLCPSNATDEAVNYTGNFFVVNGVPPRFSINGVALPDANVRPTSCNPVLTTGNTVNLCSRVGLLINSVTGLNAADNTVSAQYTAFTCAAANSPNPIIRGEAPTFSGFSSNPWCFSTNNTLVITGAFLSIGTTWMPTFAIQNIMSQVTLTGCSPYGNSGAQNCTQAILVTNMSTIVPGTPLTVTSTMTTQCAVSDSSLGSC